MKLQESINRSLQMMGVLNEDKKSDIAYRMINEMGLYDAIRYYGGYERLKQNLDVEITKDVKIGFIKEMIKKICNNINEDEEDGFWCIDINKEPLVYDKLQSTSYSPNVYDEEEDTIAQIEIFKPYFAGVYVYKDGWESGGFLAYYEDMSDNMLDKIVEFMVD